MITLVTKLIMVTIILITTLGAFVFGLEIYRLFRTYKNSQHLPSPLEDKAETVLGKKQSDKSTIDPSNDKQK